MENVHGGHGGTGGPVIGGTDPFGHPLPPVVDPPPQAGSSTTSTSRPTG